MQNNDTELSKKRGRRIKSLLKDHNMRQIDLASAIVWSPEHLSAVLNGRRTLTTEMAVSIAALFPPVRYQWLMGEDDFRTEEDRFSHILDKMEDSAKTFHSLFKGIASNFNYEIKLLDPKMLDENHIAAITDPCYAIVDRGKVIACISFDEYSRLRNEIAHYSSYLFGNLLTKTKSRVLEPFDFPKVVD